MSDTAPTSRNAERQPWLAQRTADHHAGHHAEERRRNHDAERQRTPSGGNTWAGCAAGASVPGLAEPDPCAANIRCP